MSECVSLDALIQRYAFSPTQRATLTQVAGLPKTELHLHLEGATAPETFWQLAQEYGVALPQKSLKDWHNYFQFRSFEHFIEVYTQATRCLAQPPAYTRLIQECFAAQAQQNIVYSEVFVSCSLGIQRLEQDAWLDALAAGLALGRAAYPHIEMRLIADISRELPHLQEQVLAFALAGQKRGIFEGLGLGGAEANFPPGLFQETFQEAKRHGLFITVHAGEAAGPQSIWGAIEELGAQRIGHGIRCLEDPELLHYLQKTQLPIEVSPTSNYRTGVVKADERHPIHAMLEAGLRLNLNTDDPQMFHTSFLEEAALLLAQGMLDTTLLQLLEAGQHQRLQKL